MFPMAIPLGAIEEANVLVVYNSESADSQAVHDYYLNVRPSVRSFDLNDPSILAHTISYADFALKIRQPIQTHLNSNNLEQIVEVIVLTKDIPHRIQSLDTNAPNTGDNANATISAYNNGNANFASVDSELTLLQFPLEMGEAGGSMDSVADRAVINPFFDATSSFSSFSRINVDGSNLSFSERALPGYGSWWELVRQIGPFSTTAADPGNIYLTARLDADTVDGVKAIIDRAQQITFRKQLDAIILDADARTNRLDQYLDPNSLLTRTDYSEAESLADGDWGRVFLDLSNSFLTGASNPLALADTTLITGPVAHLHSYGVNHNGDNSQIRNYLITFAQQLPPGASFSAYESFGAVGLGGLGNKGQAQVEEWFQAGGTFATGPVWEPFTFGIFKSAVFLDRFMNDGFTYVEAAWASILQISWQSVVIGDPLATANFVTPSSYELWTQSEAGTTPYVDNRLDFTADLDQDSLSNGYEYAIGLNPESSDVDSGRLLMFAFTQDGQTLKLTLDATNAEEVTILLQTTETLLPEDWTTIATRTPGIGWSGTATVEESPSSGDLNVSIIDPTVSNGKRFYRLWVENESP